MNPNAPSVLFATLLSLVIGAGGVIIADMRQQQRPPEKERDFQRLVHGLGFGPALDLSQCEFSLDPRLSGHCPEDLGPIPGGVHFCPLHACSILFYPQPIDRNPTNNAKAERDAKTP